MPGLKIRDIFFRLENLLPQLMAYFRAMKEICAAPYSLARFGRRQAHSSALCASLQFFLRPRTQPLEPREPQPSAKRTLHRRTSRFKRPWKCEAYNQVETLSINVFTTSYLIRQAESREVSRPEVGPPWTLHHPSA